MAILRLCPYSGRGSRKAQRFDATALCRPGREWATANSETPEVQERAVGMRDSVVHPARSACVQGSQFTPKGRTEAGTDMLSSLHFDDDERNGDVRPTIPEALS